MEDKYAWEGIRLDGSAASISAYRRLLLLPQIVEGLHCEHRPASTVVCDIEQRTMSTSVRGAASALSMGPSAEYNSI
jgi:hypothetical protein